MKNVLRAYIGSFDFARGMMEARYIRCTILSQKRVRNRKKSKGMNRKKEEKKLRRENVRICEGMSGYVPRVCVRVCARTSIL